jgi:hypothetical protein
MQTGSGHSGNGVGKQRKSCRQGWAPGRGGGWKLNAGGFAKTFLLNQAISPPLTEIQAIHRVPSKRATPRPKASTATVPAPLRVRELPQKGARLLGELALRYTYTEKRRVEKRREVVVTDADPGSIVRDARAPLRDRTIGAQGQRFRDGLKSTALSARIQKFFQ